jgi:hypothetical protein
VTKLILVLNGVVPGHGGLSILLFVISSFMAFVNFVALLNLLGLAFTDILLIDVVTSDPVDGAAANVLWLAITNTLHVNKMGTTLLMMEKYVIRLSLMLGVILAATCSVYVMA